MPKLNDLRKRFTAVAIPEPVTRDADCKGSIARAAAKPATGRQGSVVAALYAPGKAKAYKGWNVRVYADGTDAWAVSVKWGAIDSHHDCSNRRFLSHEKRAAYTNRPTAIKAAQSLINAKTSNGYTARTIDKELT